MAYAGESLFFSTLGLDYHQTHSLLENALRGCDDGELFLEYKLSENYLLDDGVLKTSSSTVSQGFGLRSVVEEQTGYAHSSEISHEALRRAARSLQGFNHHQTASLAIAPRQTNQRFYTDLNPLDGKSVAEKISLLQQIDSFVRSQDTRIRQVSVGLQGSWQNVCILHADGSIHTDIRPFVFLSIGVTVADGPLQEQGRETGGGRIGYDDLFQPQQWQSMSLRAVRRALQNLSARPAPAGEMPVLLGHGGPAVLLHEAVGHGFEGDFNRKGASLFSTMMGQRVAAPGVTVIDAGNIEGNPLPHGTLSIDDEGTPTQETTLIDDGIMVGHMQDRLNGRLMKASSTGNGKRQSYAHMPLPRMTNTLMRAGQHNLNEMIGSVQRGIYAVDFAGGQVDIVSGKFVFSTAEAYMIENGRITAPLKGATLIGHGPQVMQNISMIGNDFHFDRKIGVCGKAGQGVYVGMGQPSLLISSMTVGGTTL